MPQILVRDVGPPTPRAVKPERKIGRKIKVPDETILAIRRMSEIERRPLDVILEMYPQLSRHYLRSVLGYMIRCDLRIEPMK